MYAWQQIQKTIELIDQHHDENLDIDYLSKEAALSPFYYQKLFKRLVKLTVMDYIKGRRLSFALEDLKTSNKRIIDVALDHGFNSHENFSKCFKEAFQITPENYRKNPTIMNIVTKPLLDLNYTLVEENTPIIYEGIILEITQRKLTEDIHFIGYQKELPINFIEGLSIDSGTDPLYDCWAEFHKMKEEIPSRVDIGDFGVTLQSQKEGYFEYFIGSKVKTPLTYKNLKNWSLNKGELIICTVEAESFNSLVLDVLYKAQNYLFSTWLPTKAIEIEPFSIEYYPKEQENTVEIWVKKKENV